MSRERGMKYRLVQATIWYAAWRSIDGSEVPYALEMCIRMSRERGMKYRLVQATIWYAAWRSIDGSEVPYALVYCLYSLLSNPERE